MQQFITSTDAPLWSSFTKSTGANRYLIQNRKYTEIQITLREKQMRKTLNLDQKRTNGY